MIIIENVRYRYSFFYNFTEKNVTLQYKMKHFKIVKRFIILYRILRSNTIKFFFLSKRQSYELPYHGENNKMTFPELNFT